MNKFSLETEQEIIKQYLGGKSLRVVGSAYQCSPSTVSNILKRNGFQTRNYSQSQSVVRELNEEIFHNISSPEQCYWLGVMYSDGYLIDYKTGSKGFGISVKSSDKEWLEQFKSFLQWNGEIKTYTNHTSFGVVEYCRVLIRSDKIVEDLISYGCGFQKTFKIEHLPEVPYKEDFIRGVIDGDGSIRANNSKIITISGGYNFLKEIGDYLQEPHSIYTDKSIYGLHFTSLASKRILKKLYQDAIYYLPRKQKLVQPLLSH